MVDASQYLSAPFSLFVQPGSQFALRRQGSILMINGLQRKCEFIQDTFENSTKIQQNAIGSQIENYGVFGHLDLPSGPHLVLISRATLLGELIRCHIFRVDELIYVPLNRTQMPITIQDRDKPFVDMINRVVKDRGLFFSYKLDLTRNIQTNITRARDHPGDPALKDLINLFPNSVDYIPKFCFNHTLLEEYSDKQYAPFRTPCIYGYIAMQKVSPMMDFALITRKDCRRPGRRFITRGLDADGAAANFSEQEHVFCVRGFQNNALTVASHLQIRGSIPLIWSMKPNLAWAPPVIVNSNFDESFQAAKTHFKETNASYQK